MKVLLLDSAFSSLPIYEALINWGYDVRVMGNRPDDLLARNCERKASQQHRRNGQDSGLRTSTAFDAGDGQQADHPA